MITCLISFTLLNIDFICCCRFSLGDCEQTVNKAQDENTDCYSKEGFLMIQKPARSEQLEWGSAFESVGFAVMEAVLPMTKSFSSTQLQQGTVAIRLPSTSLDGHPWRNVIREVVEPSRIAVPRNFENPVVNGTTDKPVAETGASLSNPDLYQQGQLL